MDALALDGPQHIFLFRLREQHRDYLEQLRTPEYIKEQLARLGYTHLFNASEFVWDAPFPRLAEVILRPVSGAFLLLKWVETREWQEKAGTEVNEKGDRIDRWELRRGRSVNFFRVDLKTGDAEVRIQKLHTNPQKPLRNHFQTYSQLLEEMLRFELFRPVLLEPVIRGLMTSGVVNIAQWRVMYPFGPSQNAGVPSFLDQLKLRFLPFSAYELNCYWPIPNAAEVHTFLKAKGDEIEFPTERTPQKSLSVLTAIRGWDSPSFGIPQLEELARDRPEWDTLLRKVDVQLRRFRNRELDVEKFAEEEWLSPARVKQAMQEAKKRYPEVLQLKYRVHCPVNKRPSMVEGKFVEFQDVFEVPREIDCQHGRQKRVHPTEGIVRPTVIYRRQEAGGARGILESVLGRLVKVLAGAALEQFIKGTLVLLFSIPCLAVLMLAWWMSEKLSFAPEWKRLTIAIVFLLEGGAIYKVIGTAAFRAVVDILKEYLRLYSPEDSASRSRSRARAQKPRQRAAGASE